MNRFNQLYYHLLEVYGPLSTDIKKSYYDQAKDRIKSDTEKVQKKKVQVAQAKAGVEEDKARIAQEKDRLESEKAQSIG